MALLEGAHLAVVSGLTVFGFLGNVCILLVSQFTSTFKTFEFSNLVLFEILMTACGPCVSLYALHFRSASFQNGSMACRAVEFMSSFSIFGSLLALVFLMYCTRFLYTIPGIKVKRVLGLVMFLIWFSSAMLAVIPIFIERRRHFSAHPRACAFIANPSIIFSTRHAYPFAFLALVFHVIAFCFYLFVRKMKDNYMVELNWKRHRVETQLNDPECTTVQISSSEGTSVTLSMGGRLHNSPFGKRNRRLSLGEISMHSILSADVLQSLPITRITMDSNSFDVKSPALQKEDAGKEEIHGHQAVKLSKNDVSDVRKHSPTRSDELLRLSPLKLLKQSRKQIYKSPVALNFGLVDQAHREFKRTVFVILCSSLIGCLPYCIITIISLGNIDIPDGAWLVATWLLYLRPVSSPFICFACSAEYRNACMVIITSLRFLRFSGLMCCRNRKAYFDQFPGSTSMLFRSEGAANVRLSQWTQNNRWS